MDREDKNLATQMGWCPMQNAWVSRWTGFTDHDRHKGNRGWESTSISLQWADPLPLLAVSGTPQVGKNYLLDEKCPVRGFVSVAPTSLAWKDKVGNYSDNKGPAVMVWDGMLPGERESAKKIITEEHNWIIWRVKPSRVSLESERERTGNLRRPPFLNNMGYD